MKKTMAVMVGLVLTLAASGVAWSDPVAGYVEDREAFPNMLVEQPDCGSVYSEFLTNAQPLIACKHLEEAKAEQSAQQQLSKQLATMKNCKKCKAQMGQADEAAAAYGEQINIYGKQCPPQAQQLKLAAQLDKQTKKVCKACSNKWPGKLGPADPTPCN